MKTLAASLVVLLVLSSNAFAATVVTGGRCTSSQINDKWKTCNTSEFTNSAGQTGYKCTCKDNLSINPGLDPSAPLSPINPDVVTMDAPLRATPKAAGQF